MTLKVIDLSANPLDVYREFDPKIVKRARSHNRLQDLVFHEGILSQKFKMLNAMAINVEYEALRGATALGRKLSDSEPQKKSSKP